MSKIYHTETQEDFNALMEELEVKGYKWSSEKEKPTNLLSLWKVHREETCVRLWEDKLLTYDPYSFYQRIGYEIIEYKAPKKEKKAVKLEDVFTSKCDKYGYVYESQRFCTVLMKDKQRLYHEALKLEGEAYKKRQFALNDLEEVVAEERKALLENVEQLDKALKRSEE